MRLPIKAGARFEELRVPLTQPPPKLSYPPFPIPDRLTPCRNDDILIVRPQSLRQ